VPNTFTVKYPRIVIDPNITDPKERRREYLKQYIYNWQLINSDKYTSYKKEYYKGYHAKHKDEINARRRARWKIGKTRPRFLKHLRELRLELKNEVFSHYCGKPVKCQMCSYDDIRALSIDHIGGGGSKHRKYIGCGGGKGMYTWIKKNNYPEGFQVLCMNCQFIKRDENRENNQNKGVESSERLLQSL